MRYSSPAYGVAAPVAAGGSAISSKIIAIIVGLVVGVSLFFIVVAIGLGVGLGLGLRSSSSSTIPSSSQLTMPSVSCNASTATCGCPSVSPAQSSRIISGTTATANSWPWMVYLTIGSRVCSGFIVDTDHVITAANCVYNANITSITAYFGISSASDIANAVSRSISSVTYPSNYNGSASNDDIAELTLNVPVNITGTNIGLCCRPSSSSLPAVNQTGVIAGWGGQSSSSNSSDSLQQALVQVKSASSCNLSSNSTRFCASHNNVQTCPADNGGPFMIAVNNTWVCAGVITGDLGSCNTSTFFVRTASWF